MITIEIMSVVYLLHYVACVLSLVVGAFLFAISFTNDARMNLRSLKTLAKCKQSEADIFKQLIEFVSVHSHIKQLS